MPTNASSNSSGSYAQWCFTQTLNPNGTTTYCVWGWYHSLLGGGSSNNTTSCVLWTNDEFGTPCDAVPANATLGSFPLNFSFQTTPSNGSGAAPLNFTWNASASGAGLPPYHFIIYIDSAAYSFLGTGAAGNVTLTQYGLYEVDAIASDSTCSESSFVSFPLEVYGPLGPNPVSITTSASSSTVPSNVTFSVNASNLPANWSVAWATPGIFSSPSGGGSAWNAELNANYTYFFPGNYSATACFVEPDGAVYACGTSATIALGGSMPVTTSVTVPTSGFPVNVTYSATLAPGTWLPNGTYLYLYAHSVFGGGLFNESNGTSVSLTVPEGCGYPYTPYVPVAGNCSWPAVFSLDNAFGGVDAGFLGMVVLQANLAVNGTVGNWTPTLSISWGPMNGTLPLNFTLNLSATNGIAPYYYSYSVFGRTSGAVNASFLPSVAVQAWGWNGSTLNEVIPLNHTGVYWVQAFLSDSEDHWVADSLPLIVLGNVSPLAPLHVHPVVSVPAGLLAGTGQAQFSILVGGGYAPYAIQWSFGDGSYASSLPGERVLHTYLSAGTFVPTVTVTDARGHQVTETLAEVTVAPAPTIVHGPERAAPTTPGTLTFGSLSFAWVPVLAVGVVAALLLVLGRRAVRAEARRQGERLVEEALSEAGADPPSSGPR